MQKFVQDSNLSFEMAKAKESFTKSAKKRARNQFKGKKILRSAKKLCPLHRGPTNSMFCHVQYVVSSAAQTVLTRIFFRT